jgi:hypothetical protein
VSAGGGACLRSGAATGYNGATSCGSLDAANDICQGGDTVIVRGGTYANNAITGSNGRSAYCTFRSAANETVVLGGCDGNNPPNQPESMCLDVSGSWLRFDGGANNGFTTPAFSGHGIDLGVTTWYGSYDTESGCSHVSFTHVHVGRVNMICPYGEVSYSELGPSLDNNSKFFSEANPVLIEGNRIHDYDRSNTSQHMECLYFVATVNLTFRGNTVGPCDIIGIHAKEPGTGQFLNNTLENNIFLPGSNGVQYTGYTPCVNLVFRYNLVADGLIDNCSPKTITGNIFLGSGDSSCTGWSYNVFTASACGPASVIATASALFVDPAHSNYRPRSGSPAIDAGNPSNYPPTDIDGTPRPEGPRPTAGPYEAP